MTRTAGDAWRVQGDTDLDTTAAGPFDEIVVGPRDGEAWLHVEMMDSWSCWARIGEQVFWIAIERNGRARITSEETREYTAADFCPVCDRHPTHHLIDGEVCAVWECRRCHVTWSRS